MDERIISILSLLFLWGPLGFWYIRHFNICSGEAGIIIGAFMVLLALLTGLIFGE